MSEISTETDPVPLLPVTKTKLAALLQRVPFGAAMVGGGGSDGISGYALVLSMPCWLNEMLGDRLGLDVVAELQLIQAHLLVYLQFLDDALDGQSQIGPGDPAIPRAAAQDRLARLFAPNDEFWDDYRRLALEQEASARWEREGRHAPHPQFDDRLFRAIAAKGALLRWPAFAMARLARRPAEKDLLDDVFARFLGVVLLLDDISDVEEDAEAGRINAVLCAGRVPSRDPLEFYPYAYQGAQLVCARARAEIDWLLRAAPAGSGFARICDHLASRCAATEADFAIRCQARTAGHIFSTLAKPAPDSSGDSSDAKVPSR